MPRTDDAVLADVVLVLVTDDDHLVRRVGDRWACIRPRHLGHPCSTELPAAARGVTETVR